MARLTLCALLQAQLPGFFFNPVQFHRQLPDLLVELGYLFLIVHRLFRAGLKEFGQSFPNDFSPLRDLHGMDRVFSSDLPDRFNALDGVQSDLCF